MQVIEKSLGRKNAEFGNPRRRGRAFAIIIFITLKLIKQRIQ
jgi:hypothetical protein